MRGIPPEVPLYGLMGSMVWKVVPMERLEDFNKLEDLNYILKFCILGLLFCGFLLSAIISSFFPEVIFTLDMHINIKEKQMMNLF